ncbi:hypothetical protein [Bacillus atrophaeus]|uniref:hypothetical protein n=1 Tax=Bacillus atrophaeus TaxID=1452 RepID=UPI002E1F3C98|nr:hypothetical protein [Bacillus atrophaeus]
MRIINLQQFIRLPRGVLYTKFEPDIFCQIAIKEDSIPETNDWLYQDLLEIKSNDSVELDEILSKAVENGDSFELDYKCLTRDGLFKSDQLFAVFEKEDVKSLIKRLNETLDSYPKIE